MYTTQNKKKTQFVLLIISIRFVSLVGNS